MKKVTQLRDGVDRSISATGDVAGDAGQTQSDELQQVRELLFGHQQRAQDGKATELQNNLESLARSTDARLERQTASFAKQLEQLNKKIVALTDANTDLTLQLSQKVESENNKLNSLFLSEVAQLSDRLEQHKQLTHDLDVQSQQRVNAQLKEERNRIADALKTVAAALQKGD